MVNLFEIAGKDVNIVFTDGQVMSGFAASCSGALDNDESREDELDLEAEDGHLYCIRASEIASIQVLEPAQSKKRFPLVAASL
ncbi:MAG: hypothetical protein LBC43_00300 [Bifidobacteriaceae bacterium]|jgi:hypothetical protein|nr:hypothetical protein [Bifidobacteriaceae bacterium]